MLLISSLFMEVLEFVLAKYFLDYYFVLFASICIYGMKMCSLESYFKS